jgi:hypothetical protein
MARQSLAKDHGYRRFDMTKKRGAVATKSRRLRLTKRVVNTKRHTIGYKASKDFYSTSQITRMAKKGEVAGVRVVGNHIQTPPGARRRLIDLPTEIRGKKNRR